MRKYLSVFCILYSVFSFAQTQPGLVRTVNRPNHPSEQLGGVMLRVRGNHNAVVTDEHGSFALLMQGLEAGQAYALSSVVKSGYELREPEIIGRKQSFSTEVPLEIVMISSQVLMQERMRIEEKARDNVEKRYQERLAELDKALSSAKLSNEEYETQLTTLEEQYERFEPLLQTMSRYYAVTDYDSRDTLAARINERIEAGDLDEAERLIKAKGNIADREAQLRKLEEQNQRTEQLLAEAQKRLQEQQAEAQRQKDDLAKDCYHLFVIATERFQNDSAELYICKRAELDTTNTEFQFNAGQYLMLYRAKYAEAEQYFQRALRQAELRDGHVANDVATALNDLGVNWLKQGELDKALSYFQQSKDLREQLTGKNSVAVAESYENLGALYARQRDYKQALKMYREALQIFAKELPATDPCIPQARNNLGEAYFQLSQPDEAGAAFRQALDEFVAIYGEKHYQVAIVYNNLAGWAFVTGDLETSEQQFAKAVELFDQTLGEHHPRTKLARKNLNFLRSKKQ